MDSIATLIATLGKNARTAAKTLRSASTQYKNNALNTGYWMNIFTRYQSYVDPPCYPTGYCMNISWDISHMLIPNVTQLVIGCTCSGISVIC
jgi:hypothetical protein